MGRRKIPDFYYDFRQMPEVITTKEAAVFLRVSDHTVGNLAR